MRVVWLTVVATTALYCTVAACLGEELTFDASAVPGIVIYHSAAASQVYVGSPGIARLSNGDYLAKCDEFGPRSSEDTIGVTRMFRSRDRGVSWTQLPEVRGMYWATIFTHSDAVYLMGPNHHFGSAVIMRSTDAGDTWTVPKDGKSGLLMADGRYHTAPVPLVVYQGRLWRCMERFGPQGEGPLRYEAFALSAPVDADLLRAASWTRTNFLRSDGKWLERGFTGWLEGNAVVTPDGSIVDILRVNGPLGRLAAMVRISKDGHEARFDAKTDFIDFPGGAKKFTIRYDARSEKYWSLTNYVLPADRNLSPGGTRNTLAMIASPDLRNWEVRCLLLHHADTRQHAFQYVDWQFEGEDLIVASRTAFDDGMGGAHNAHDANFLTFHRVKDFRMLTGRLEANDAKLNRRAAQR